MIVLPVALFWLVMICVFVVFFGIYGIPFDIPYAEKQKYFSVMHDRFRDGSGLLISVIMTALMIFTMAAVNQFLTRKIIKRIMKPLDTLSYGVRQIGGNNLACRLDYREDDEFRPVCDTFNETAARLETMVAEREKNEEVRRELIAGISHDLRTPLTSIQVSASGLASGVAATTEQREKYLAIIENQTAAMEHIIEQLFLFSKLDTGVFPADMQTVDCGAMIEDCVEELSGEYERRGLALIARELPHDARISIDPLLFRRVIINIFENAVNYKTAETGCLVIDYVKGESIKITLADDGPGVAPEYLEKIFDVFYRADPSRNKKGSGLGLAISAKIIARMGGTVHAELPAAGGLAIVLNFPPAEKAAS
jgi:signal transduction histidine kinase